MAKFKALTGRYAGLLYVTALIAIAFISHRIWFDPASVLSFGDWAYWPTSGAKQLYFGWGSWLSFIELGFPNIQITFLPFMMIWSLVANLGGTAGLAAKITFFIPTAILGFVSPYLLFKKLLDNRPVAFTVALYYGTTTHFLIRQSMHLTLAMVYALSPLIFLFFIKALDKNTFRSWSVFAVLFSVGIIYEVRISLILLCVLVLYFLVSHMRDIGKYWTRLAFCALLGILLNAYWLLPVAFGDLSARFGGIIGAGLFGDQLYDLRHAFTLTEAAWTGGFPNFRFVLQAVPWFAWIIPCLAFLAILTAPRDRKKDVVFFAVLAMVGVFLTKQSAEPFSHLYLWFYKNLPGFGMFREASKFYLLTALGYAGLIGLGLIGIKTIHPRRAGAIVFAAALAIIAAISLWNLKPMINGDYRSLHEPRVIDRDYQTLISFIDRQPGFFRTLWVPHWSRWGPFSIDHPKISMSLEDFNRKKTDGFLDEAGIKYVIVPIQSDGKDLGPFWRPGSRRSEVIRALDKKKYIKKVDIGTEALVVYENIDYGPHLSGRDVSFQEINPTAFRVTVKGVKRPRELTFAEAYDAEWQLILRPNDKKAGKSVIRRFDRQQTTEYKAAWSFIPLDKYALFGKTSPGVSTYESPYYGTGKMLIDPEEIKRKNPAGMYRVNKDGSLDLSFNLFFRPQRYFYTGVFLSMITFIILLASIMIGAVRGRRAVIAAVAEPQPASEETAPMLFKGLGRPNLLTLVGVLMIGASYVIVLTAGRIELMGWNLYPWHVALVFLLLLSAVSGDYRVPVVLSVLLLLACPISANLIKGFSAEGICRIVFPLIALGLFMFIVKGSSDEDTS